MDDQPNLYEPELDAATQAFARLEGEMALVRRAVEHLATEKAEIVIPDYSTTLGEMAQALADIADKPAMQFTPEDLAARIDATAAKARQKDHEELQQSHRRFDQAAHDLRNMVRSARTADEQHRRLHWTAGGGLAAGIVLWSFLPGAIARTVPASWHWPEAMATRTLGEPTIWEAGARLMRVGSPPAWEALSEAADTLRDNREAIDRCRREAAGSDRSVRCTIQIQPPGRP
jgi:hypothetical protein